jgi:hypothetical protein
MATSILVALAGAVSLLFGIRYLFARQFMPYHAAVAGRSWSELEPGVRTVILGMLRIVGGGLAAYGLALLWLLIPLGARQPWAAWAVLSLSACVVLPTLYVTLWLRRAAPAAHTPVAPTLVVLVLVVTGAALSFF